MLELGRSDIGFGRLVLDDRGITHHKLFGADHLAWDDIDDYRLTIELTGHAPDLAYLIEGLNAIAMIGDVRGSRGRRILATATEITLSIAFVV